MRYKRPNICKLPRLCLRWPLIGMKRVTCNRLLFSSVWSGDEEAIKAEQIELGGKIDS